MSKKKKKSTIPDRPIWGLEAPFENTIQWLDETQKAEKAVREYKRAVTENPYKPIEIPMGVFTGELRTEPLSYKEKTCPYWLTSKESTYTFTLEDPAPAAASKPPPPPLIPAQQRLAKLKGVLEKVRALEI